MKKFGIILGAFALSGCAQLLTSAPVLGPVCAAADKTLIDEKVVYAADALYNIPAQAAVTADANGKLPPALKAKLKPLLLKLYQYDLTIKAAQGSANCDFTAMKTLYSEVTTLLPRN